jgi:peptidyl-prolyl cis-trans isomerase B (cyclophilin B)
MRTPPRTLAVLLACVFLALAAGCGEDEQGGAQATATPPPEDTGGEQTGACTPAAEPKPKNVSLDKPSEKLKAGRTYVATVVTNCGTFEITLAARRAPRTGGSFKYLADQGFYDGTTFHRIEPGFVIQGGDPAGDGTGGPGFSVVEPPPQDLVYARGVVAMAKTELEKPGTSGSQFFIVTGEAPHLPPEYALVGEVTGGEDVVDRIGVLPVNSEAKPVEPVVIESVTVEAQ